MQANEMKILFLIKFGKLYDFESPSYDDRQISQLLTDAQLRIVLYRYSPKGNKHRKGLEADEKRTQDLSQLIKPAYYSPSYTSESGGVKVISKPAIQNGVHPNGIFLEMPEDYLWPVEETATINDRSKEIDVYPVTHDEYIINKDNPFGSPYKDKIWRMDISRYTHASGTETENSKKRIEIILSESDTLNSYRVRYVMTPPDIVVDTATLSNQRHCILDETLHNAIVDEAVSIAYAASQQQSYQIGMNESLKSE